MLGSIRKNFQREKNTMLYIAGVPLHPIPSGDRGRWSMVNVFFILQSIFIYFKLICIGVWLLYNVVLVSVVQQSESPVCVHMCVLVAQSCSTLCNPVDCSLPGSSVHGKNTGVGWQFLLQCIHISLFFRYPSHLGHHWYYA